MMACSRTVIPRVLYIASPIVSSTSIWSSSLSLARQRTSIFPSQSVHAIPVAFRCRVHSEATAEPATRREDGDSFSKDWTIKMLYDGDCPLCMREVSMLKERNKSYGAIKFIDISSKDYSAEENQGLDYKTVMGRIHAIQSDGTVFTDVEAFRRLYEEVGLGWVYAVTKYEPIATLANAVYGIWAKYRLQITGRPPLEEIMELRRKDAINACSEDKACKM